MELMMHDDFVYLTDRYGKPDQPEKLDADEARRLHGKLPDTLLEFWSECGIGGWLNNKLQFCNPGRYAGIVDMIFEGDNDFAPEKMHLFAFGAFGELRLWNEDKETLSVDLPYLRAYAEASSPDWSRGSDHIALVSTLTGLEHEGSLSLFENTSAAPPMFKKCVKAHGALGRGECYGLAPALALGGNCRTANVRRVRALEHFALLAQLGPVRLSVAHGSGTVTTLRTLGGG